MERNGNQYAYQRKRKMERNMLFSQLDHLTKRLQNDLEFYRQYLDTQAILDKYSVANTLLISAKLPRAIKLKTFEDWKAEGVYIRSGEESVSIFEPYEYETRNGELRSGYKVKKLFDISQTNARQKAGKNLFHGIAKRQVLKVLIGSAPVQIEVMDEIHGEKLAEYDEHKQMLSVQRGLSQIECFQALSKELAYVQFALGDPGLEKTWYETPAEIASYLLCKR